MPTSRAPARPGPSVTAMASRSAKVMSGFARGRRGRRGRCCGGARGRLVRGRLRRSWRGGPSARRRRWRGLRRRSDDGGGGLVAGAFDAENEAGFDHVVCTPSPYLNVSKSSIEKT